MLLLEAAAAAIAPAPPANGIAKKSSIRLIRCSRTSCQFGWRGNRPVPRSEHEGGDERGRTADEMHDARAGKVDKIHPLQPFLPSSVHAQCTQNG